MDINDKYERQRLLAQLEIVDTQIEEAQKRLDYLIQKKCQIIKAIPDCMDIDSSP